MSQDRDATEKLLCNQCPVQAGRHKGHYCMSKAPARFIAVLLGLQMSIYFMPVTTLSLNPQSAPHDTEHAVAPGRDLMLKMI